MMSVDVSGVDNCNHHHHKCHYFVILMKMLTHRARFLYFLLISKGGLVMFRGHWRLVKMNKFELNDENVQD